jgi:hypothetical protein
MFLDNTLFIFLATIKEKIRLVQYEASKAVNTHLRNLYWTKHMSGLERNL